MLAQEMRAEDSIRSSSDWPSQRFNNRFGTKILARLVRIIEESTMFPRRRSRRFHGIARPSILAPAS